MSDDYDDLPPPPKNPQEAADKGVTLLWGILEELRTVTRVLIIGMATFLIFFAILVANLFWNSVAN